MNEDDERGETVDLGRTLALSDGIFAISLTLLAFQIQPPDLKSADVHLLAGRLADMSDRYFVYVLSFLVIGVLWLVHHRLFRRIDHADEPLMGLNLVFLMVVAGLPFPSAVLGRYGSERAAVVLYAATMALAGTLLLALTILVQRRGLLGPGMAGDMRVGMWRTSIMAGVFGLSIPIAFIAPSVAPWTWIAMAGIRLVPIRPSRNASQGDATIP